MKLFTSEKINVAICNMQGTSEGFGEIIYEVCSKSSRKSASISLSVSIISVKLRYYVERDVPYLISHFLICVLR